MLWILLAMRVLRYSSIMLSENNTASTGSISSTEGPNTDSAGNMREQYTEPRVHKQHRRTNIRNTLQWSEYPEYIEPGNTASARNLLPKWILLLSASILQALQLPPAKLICLVSHSRDQWTNAFIDAPSTWEYWKVFSRENASDAASTRSTVHISKLCTADCVILVVFRGSRVLHTMICLWNTWYYCTSSISAICTAGTAKCSEYWYCEYCEYSE